jgi:hypothetical protein
MDKIQKLQQYDNGHYWSVARVEYNGTNYAVVNDGANRYVLQYNDIHSVDELVHGDLNYSRWCSSNYTFDQDEDIPGDLQQAIRHQLDIDPDQSITIHGSI